MPATSSDTSPLDLAMRAYARGDDTRFAEVFRLAAPQLRRFLARRVDDAAHVEDLVQDTMLRVHRARASFQPEARALPWLIAIARGLLIDEHRRAHRIRHQAPPPAELTMYVSSPVPDVMSLLEVRELQLAVDRALAVMPLKLRSAFELLRLEGLSVSSAADRLDASPGAVKVRAHRAYRRLRTALARAGMAA